MNNWTDRVKARMKELGITQETLANKMGITRGAVTHYLAGRRVPPLKQFQKLAAVLKADPAWLHYGAENAQLVIKNNKKEITKQSHHQIPILSWEQAAGFSNNSRKDSKTPEYLANFFTNNENWYALRVKDDTMTSSLSNSKNFHEGDIIIIDPDRSPEHGNYVVALLPQTNEATFKQYIVDGGIHYLKPLNPQYPILKIEKKVRICGIVVNRLSYF